MGKILSVLLSVMLGIGILECNSSKQSAPDSPIGVYQYTGYDKAGKRIVEGSLEITSLDDANHLKGTWQLKPVGNADKIGPQTGSGTFVGDVDKDTVRINLNPNMADNNVYLSGKIERNRIQGDWSFSGFAGVISQGKFEANRK